MSLPSVFACVGGINACRRKLSSAASVVARKYPSCGVIHQCTLMTSASPAGVIRLFHLQQRLLCFDASISSRTLSSDSRQPSLRSASKLKYHHRSRYFTAPVCSFLAQMRPYSQVPENSNLNDSASLQGIQGDDQEMFKAFLDNCKRYGLHDCDEQYENIKSGKKTIGQVMAEQEKEIAAIIEQYNSARQDQRSSAQGVQGDMTSFPDIDSLCPQGVQGQDCAQFKLWLENCHKFGLQDCMQQYEHFKANRKTLAQILAEQDKMIREAATSAYQKSHRRSFYTSSVDTNPPQKVDEAVNVEGKVHTETDNVNAKLTARQKLKRAVKEYGSTVIVFHVAISLMSLGFFYLLVSNGVDVAGLLMRLDIGSDILQSRLAAGTGTFVIAYAVHKVFAPVRIATTLTATPFIVRYLRQIGFLKVPKK